jgi:hypothetical protein
VEVPIAKFPADEYLAGLMRFGVPMANLARWGSPSSQVRRKPTGVRRLKVGEAQCGD